MKARLLCAFLLSCTTAICFAQTTQGQTNQGQTAETQLLPITTKGYSGGDVNSITKRIISSDYRLTPGDTFELTITTTTVISTTTSEENFVYTLDLQENYELDVPYIGTINAKGMHFTELRKLVTEKLRKLLPLAQFVGLSFKSPALFDVEVFGWVQSPGTITVNPLSRVSDAIAAAYGIRTEGSSRRIELLREGQKTLIDLPRYGSGEKEDANPVLEPGDRIFVPQAIVRADVSGLVNEPGTYELVPGETLATLLEYAGGVKPEAASRPVEIQRFNPDGNISLVIVDVKSEPNAAVQNGDRVRIPIMTENKRNIIVTGAVYGTPVSGDKPADVPTLAVSKSIPYFAGMTLLDALDATGGPTSYAAARQSAVVHESGKRVLIDVETLWSTRSASLDITLEPGDTVSVPIVNSVFVLGEVGVPGKVPYSPGFSVADYIAAVGGVNTETGNPNEVFFVDAKGVRTRAPLDQNPQPGSVITVDKNFLYGSQYVWQQVAVVAGIIVAVIELIQLGMDFYIDYIKPYL